MRICATSDDLMNLARKLLALAEREGAEEAEVFGVCGRSVDVDLRKDKVELASESFHRGLGLRAVISGAVGFSSTSDLNQLEYVATSAVRSARARGRDEFWQSLPFSEAVQRPQKIFDSHLERIEPEECIELALGMLWGCGGVKGAEPVSGGATCISGLEFVVNSRGVELSESSTSMHAFFEAIARGQDVATGSEFHNSRTLERDLKEVGEKSAALARASLSGIKAESGTFEVLLKPLAFAELLENAFIPSIFGDNVQKGRSSLKDRIGKSIASENLDMIDDGLLSGGMGSSAFDGEGVPSRKTPVLEGGVLRSFLYDSYYAGRAGLKSTGNALRSSYAEVPRVGVRNLIVSAKETCDLYEDTRGILVNGFIGAHTANSISGDFSVEARNSFYVSPYEESRPIKSMMLAGNIFDLLKDIEVGTDVRAVGSVVTPTVKVKMKVVGG